jgi:hypothetical protein
VNDPTGYDAVAAECPHGYPAKVHDAGWDDGAVMVHVHDAVGALCCVPGRRVAGVAHPSAGWAWLHGEIKSEAFEAAEGGA